MNTTSVLASSPVPRLFATHAYTAAKGALLSLTVASAAYYATEGIRMNAIAPALTTSRMSERAASDHATVAFARARQPLSDGFIAAEDVAAAALYLHLARVPRGHRPGPDRRWRLVRHERRLTMDADRARSSPSR